MKEKYQKILCKFCGSNPHRPDLHKPFYDGVDVCASDERWLIKVNPSIGLDIPCNSKKRIVVSAPETVGVLSVEELVKSFLSCRMEEEEIELVPAVKCDECNGLGEVEFEYESPNTRRTYYQYCDCPICGGSGNIREAKTQKTGKRLPVEGMDFISINGCVFDSYRLFHIVEVCDELGVDKIELRLKPHSPCSFRINDMCEIILMSYNSSITPSASIKIKEQ